MKYCMAGRAILSSGSTNGLEMSAFKSVAAWNTIASFLPSRHWSRKNEQDIKRVIPIEKVSFAVCEFLLTVREMMETFAHWLPREKKSSSA